MLDNQTKKRIDDCRDILVGKLPDPKSQIEQITIGLIYKFMDDMDKEAIELGGAAKFFSGEFEKYSWDNLFDAKVTAVEMLQLYSGAIESMTKNPNIPQLFRDIFKNAYLPYRDPETLKLFLKTIGEFTYTHSEKLGDAFEYLLSVMGSQGDAGQFRTPRHIIDFLVAAVNPGKTDTILDPACGTAGFLISAFKYIKAQNNNELTPDERKRLIQNFAGYDISPDMVRLSLVNLYLHGFSDPKIVEYDTLSSEERWQETFDVVLANPPFMSPKGGIRPHKKFTISSNRSEVLFVDYIAEHLNPKGRAGIIVPEGVIFQSGTAYKELRKMLVDHYLYAVVSLPAGVFNPYSGVKTSILLMDKELAKKSKDILFVKIDNDGYNLGAQRNAVKGGQLEAAMDALQTFRRQTASGMPFENTLLAQAVGKAEIAKNGDYNLSGERYKGVIHFNSSSIEIVMLSDISDVEYGFTDTAKDEGDARFIRITDINEYGQLRPDSMKYIHLNRDSKKFLLKQNDILVARTGATFGKTLIYENNEPAVFASYLIRIKLDTHKILPKYYWAFAQSDVYWNQANNLVTGGGQPQFNGNALKQIQIPLPPLSIQEAIVAEIEGYQKIIDGAKMVVDSYKPNIEIDPAWEMVALGELVKIQTGGTPSKSNELFWEGNIPWVSPKDMKVDFIGDSEDHISIEAVKDSSTKIVPEKTVLIVVRSGILKHTLPIALTVKPVSFNQDIIAINPVKNSLMPEYLFYYLKSTASDLIELGIKPGVTVQSFHNGFFKNLNIPLPNIETQRQIVAQIEKEQALVNANKELIQIFEQKIRERIAKVWGGSTPLTNPNSTPLSTSDPDLEEPLSMAAEPEVEYVQS